MNTFFRHTLILGIALLGSASMASANEFEPLSWEQPDATCCAQPWGVSASVDWLYWKARQEDMDFGTFISRDSPTSFSTTQEILRPRFKSKNGIRGAISIDLPCQCWGVGVAYTYLPSHAQREQFANGNPTSIIGGQFGNFRFDAASVKARWNLNLRYLDVDIARTICVTPSLELRPYIGVRSMWMKQSFELSFIGFSGDLGKVDIKQRFTGTGIEGGLWADWQLGCGFSLLGHAGGAVLYSKFRRSQLTTDTSLDFNNFDAFDTVRTATPMVDYFIGIKYSGCTKRFPFELHLGWEQHILFDVNRLTRQGNLSLQGVTFGAGIAF